MYSMYVAARVRRAPGSADFPWCTCACPAHPPTDCGMAWHRFDGAVAFNQDIGRWDTGRVVNMYSLYVIALPAATCRVSPSLPTHARACVHNLSLSARSRPFSAQTPNPAGLCVVWHMCRFQRASSFNQNVDGWAVGSVETLAFAFVQATAFDQDLSSVTLWRAATVGRRHPARGARLCGASRACATLPCAKKVRPRGRRRRNTRTPPCRAVPCLRVRSGTWAAPRDRPPAGLQKRKRRVHRWRARFWAPRI